jgi:hypothetical protein
MYVIIGSHFVALQGKFLLIALVIVSITLKYQKVQNNCQIVVLIVFKGVLCDVSACTVTVSFCCST